MGSRGIKDMLREAYINDNEDEFEFPTDPIQSNYLIQVEGWTKNKRMM